METQIGGAVSELVPTEPAAVSLDRFLSWHQVRERVGLSRTLIWRLRVAGKFPQGVRLSPGRIAWRESDVIAWMASRRTAA